MQGKFFTPLVNHYILTNCIKCQHFHLSKCNVSEIDGIIDIGRVGECNKRKQFIKISEV